MSTIVPPSVRSANKLFHVGLPEHSRMSVETTPTSSAGSALQRQEEILHIDVIHNCPEIIGGTDQ